MNLNEPNKNSETSIKDKGGRPRVRPINKIEQKEYAQKHYKNLQMIDDHQHLNPEQINKLLSYAKKDYERMLIYLGIRTGRRLTELLTLKYGDIYWDEQKIDFDILKKRLFNHKKKKWVRKEWRVSKPYPDEVFEELWKYTHTSYSNGTYDLKSEPRFKKEDYIFPFDLNNIDRSKLTIKYKNEMKKKHLTRQSVDKFIKRIGRNAGINLVGSKKLHFHLLRHTYAVWFGQEALTPIDISKLKDDLEHSRADTTMFYLKFNTTQAMKNKEDIYKKYQVNMPKVIQNDKDKT